MIQGAKVYHNTNGLTVVGKKCHVTGKYYTVTMPTEQWHDWMNGMLIQKAMPALSADQREFLISGTSPEGFKILFPKESEDDAEG